VKSERGVRVLFISSSFHPVIGGAETYAWDVVTGMRARGHEVVVVTDVPRGHAPGEVSTENPEGVTVRRLSRYRELLADPSKLHWEQMAFSLMPELAECAGEFGPDLVMTNSLDTSPLGKTVALDRDIPWVAAFHEHAPQDEPLGAGRLRLVYEVLRPDLVLVGSQFYAQRARRWGGAGLRTRLIYHGVDTDRFRPGVAAEPVRRRYGVAAEEILIVCSGRLKPRKGIRELIRAFAPVHERHPRTRLLIVGSVSSASLDYAAALEADIKELGLPETVIIDQGVTFDQMPEVLAAADIVAQPSFEEGLGMAVLEAMSSARPVVTTDIPGVREILTAPGIAEVLPPGRLEPLTDALLKLVGDRRLRERLGRSARQHVEQHFSRRRMLEQTESALLEVTARTPTAPEAPRV
jgi:glycosyltransferase involved in cell wall biosynthesis